MTTTVLTTHPIDIGAGPKPTATFPDCRWHVDETGTLHIIREGGRGTVASFAIGTWQIVMDDGVLVASKGPRR